MKINEILAEVKLTGTTPTQGGSALGSFLRGAGMSQGTDAADAYANANALTPGVRQTKIRKPNANRVSAADKAAAAADAKRARFIAIIKQQADRQGTISMTDIGKRIPKQGEYADLTRRREAIRNIAQELQQQGVTVTTDTVTPQPAPTANINNTASTPLPTIGGIGPNDPRYAALAARTRNAPATPVR